MSSRITWRVHYNARSTQIQINAILNVLYKTEILSNKVYVCVCVYYIR